MSSSSDLIAYKKSSQDGRIAVYLLHKHFLEEQDGNCLPITGVIKHNKSNIEEDKIFCLVNLTYRYEHGEDTISVQGYERSIQLINSHLKSDGISGDLKPKILNYDVEYEKQVEQRRKDMIEAQIKLKELLEEEEEQAKKSEEEQAKKSEEAKIKISENQEAEKKTKNEECKNNLDNKDASTEKSNDENESAEKSNDEEVNTEKINENNEVNSSNNEVSDNQDTADKSENQNSEMENGKDENKELEKCSDSADKPENQLTETEKGKDENGESEKSSDIADKSENQLTEIENGKDGSKESQESSDKKPDDNNKFDNKPMENKERRRSSTFHPYQSRIDEMMLLYALPVPTDDQMNALKPIQNSNNEEFDSRQKKLQEALMKKLKEEGDGSIIPFSIKIPAEAPNAAFIASEYKSKKSPVGVSYRFSVYADTAIKEVPSKSSSASFPVLKKQIGSYATKKSICESKRIACEPGFFDLSLHSDSNIFFHGEGIEMTVKFENKSKKTVKFVRCDVVQHVYIPTTGSKYERVVATLESREYCPVLPSYKYSRKFVLVPDIKYIAEDNKGITYLGSFKTSEFQLASSYIPSENPNNLDETLGVHVSYSVKASVAFGTVLGNISLAEDIFIYEDKSLVSGKEKLSDDIDVEVEDIA